MLGSSSFRFYVGLFSEVCKGSLRIARGISGPWVFGIYLSAINRCTVASRSH